MRRRAAQGARRRLPTRSPLTAAGRIGPAQLGEACSGHPGPWPSLPGPGGGRWPLAKQLAIVAAALLLAACSDDADTAGPIADAADATADIAVPTDVLDAGPGAPDSQDAATPVDTQDASPDAMEDTTPDTTPDATDAAQDAGPDVEELPWETAPASIELGDEATGRLTVTTSPLALTVTRGGETLISTANGAPFGLATSTVVGPEYFHDPYAPAHPITWHELTAADATLEQDGEIALRLVGDVAATLWIRAEAPGRFGVRLVAAPTANDTVIARAAIDAHPDDRYYGLGETFDGVQQRGRRRSMHFVPAPLEAANNETHVPIPFFTSVRGWGLFAESRRAGVFDLAATDETRVIMDFAGAELQLHLIAGEDRWEPLRHYVDMTGKPSVPAAWAFGPQLWRNENEDQAEVLADAAAIRDNDLAGSVIWIDRPWEQNYNDHKFDEAQFPDPKAMIDELHAKGFRVVVWSSPYLDDTLEEETAQALAGGWFPEVPGDGWVDKFGPLLDLTHPDAVTLWKSLISNCTTLGVEGFKLDYGEDVQLGFFGVALPFKFHNGETQATMHHHYAWYFHKPYADMVPADGGFVLSRAGTYGDQTLTSAVWPGDLDSGFQVYGDSGSHVGGLPSAISGGLSLSTSGYPFYGSDTGGFRHGRPTKHVMARWIEYSALGTIMQTGGGGKNHNPWDFATYDGAPELLDEKTTSQYDDELLGIYRDYARLHTRLFPYIYTYAWLAHDTGRPVTVPFGFAFPETDHHPDHDFTLGDWLLVEPVIDATFARTITLPAGRWIDWFTGDVVTGPASFERPLALAELALYAREGALIPLLRDDVDTLAPTTDPTVTSTALDPGVLTVRVFPSASPTSFALFDDTALTQSWAGDTLTVTTTPGTTYGAMRLDVAWSARPDGDAAPPSQVLVDGAPAPFEATDDHVTVDLDDAPHTIELVE